MNIDLLKQVEDLTRDKNEVWSELKGLINEKINNVIIEALNDFEKYFKSKGFTIQKSNTNIIASYGKLKADMKFSPYTLILDSYPCFELKLLFPEEKLYMIGLFNNTSNHFAIILSKGNDDKALKYNVEKLNDEILKTKERIESFDTEQWSLAYENVEQPTNFDNSFTSLYDLLESVLS